VTSAFKNAVDLLRVRVRHALNNFATRSAGNDVPFDFKTICGIGSTAKFIAPFKCGGSLDCATCAA
jgi:hypothetical protein